jgi:hypothetical protein
MLAAAGSGIDAFSYHHYGAVSQRCSGIPGQITAEAALSAQTSDEMVPGFSLGRLRPILDLGEKLQFDPDTPQDNQLTSKHRVLRFKRDLNGEARTARTKQNSPIIPSA